MCAFEQEWTFAQESPKSLNSHLGLHNPRPNYYFPLFPSQYSVR